MVDHVWDYDEEADEWAKNHSKKDSNRESLRNPRNSYHIELEHRRGRISLTQEEWKILQRFLHDHESRDLVPSQYMHLPKKVRLVVYDWVQS